MTMRIERTVAKIGRSTKNRERLIRLTCSRPPIRASRRNGRQEVNLLWDRDLALFRADVQSRLCPLYTADDEPIIGFQSLSNNPKTMNQRAQLNHAILDRIVA